MDAIEVSPVRLVATKCACANSPAVDHRFNRAEPRRLHLLSAAAVSLVLHGALLYQNVLWPSAPIVKPSKRPEATIVQLEMPPLEPDPVDEVVELSENATAQAFAPPSLADLPTVVPIDAFTQPIQPPMPTMQPGQGMTTIPIGKPGTGFGKGVENLFDIANLDQRPELRAALPPDYPYAMRQYNLTGRVTVEYIIDTSGTVMAVRVLDSSHEAFEQAAVRAVAKWRFKPGRKNGRVVNVRVQQIITFNLEKD